MRAFFQDGGRLIDSSPMYGSSQEVIGYGLRKLGTRRSSSRPTRSGSPRARSGPQQIAESLQHWGIPRFDLLEVHNLMSWEEHLPTLFAMKKAGRLRYVGVTTSEGRRHDEMEKVMRSQPIDFVQVTYNVLDREVEERILPLALERRIGVICNRPLRRGELIRRVERAPLPVVGGRDRLRELAAGPVEVHRVASGRRLRDPATSRVDHVRQNVGASYGRLPDEAMRRRIVAHVEKL